jgi:hypothetical protein
MSICASSRPRIPVHMDGTSADHIVVSLTTITSHASLSRSRRSSDAKFGDPDSSSPSISSFTVTAGVSRPVAARCARMPSRCMATLPLSSIAPRACSSGPSGLSTTVGSNGGCTHRSSGSTGCTSWWPYTSATGASLSAEGHSA